MGQMPYLGEFDTIYLLNGLFGSSCIGSTQIDMYIKNTLYKLCCVTR